MPDIDLTETAEEIRQSFTPRYDEVVGRAARRRRWRAWLAGLAVAVLGGGLAVGLATTAAGPPDPAPVPLPPGLANGPMVAGDSAHLYQVFQPCADGPCLEPQQVAVSSDLGHTWTLRAGPGSPDHGVEVLAAAGPAVLAVNHGGQVSAPTRWVSTDAGSTWRPAAVERGILPSTLPTAFVLDDRLTVLDAASGVLTSDSRPLPLRQARFVTSTRPDGVWRIVGYRTERPAPMSNTSAVEGVDLAIAESTDGGRLWDVRSLPRDAGFGEIVTADGTDLYAGYRGAGTVEIFVSRDAGRTWTAGATVAATTANLLATREGSLYVATPAGVLRSTDHGRTLGPSELDTTHTPSFQVTPDGYLAATWHTVNAWWSEDGVTWREIL
ncbi:hypothetical protein [Asanoa siamensis]|uniref:Exo-alpha-sialidase n=1 Tax=Asanoa siamensis TaxID=926357 RepID=A0ABQ4CJQ8_9ACTN|nr:hypothetical protein [Asanoa siamensis]GIF71518.1 hypothetical protein Asi02nite_10360 [Asanoa siamensis]